ncbi:beta-ketoacyl synthase (plasmid) [Fischerella sp. NIES-4106]|nr:beta-ketoacyl synthase [Fischerella sp. NIES-4106]
MESNKNFFQEPCLDIAIVGLTGRFPGAKNLNDFWHNIQNGVESITFFSESDLLSANIDSTVLNAPNYVKAASILEDIENFDASFFGFEPREAEIIDPQHRLFLECAWEALENAGYTPETYKGLIGIYAGSGINTYLLENLYPNRDAMNLTGGNLPLQGISPAFLTTSVSYKLNLKGPSINLQTFCSTSLVAVHLACQSLLNEECDMALAGGVSIKVPQKAGYFYQEGGMLSPDGHTRAFDAKAQGTVFGNGVGIVVLKRLEDALADGDCIHAVIKGSAINNDGSLKVNFTAPGVEGPTEVIVEALNNAGLSAEDISYIETHGTGTTMGDLIEMAALKKAFHTNTQKKGFCAIGSVKTNIGHMDAAAGVTSLIKTILALKHKQLPPSLHFEEANPQIDFANSPFYVNTNLSEWKTEQTLRRAGVSSLAYGGTNAHIILEEAPVVKHSDKSRPWQLLVLSAKTSSALETATTNLVTYLNLHPDINLANVTYTLQVGRRAFNHRRVIICQNVDDAVTTLETKDPQRVFTVCQHHLNRPVVFMFPGQGTQYVNMALELYQTEPIFREQVDICTDILKPHLGLDIRNVLYPSQEQFSEAVQQLQQIAIAQSALFVIEYALAKLWMTWGIRPQAMIGQSVGEYVAACLAGVFSLEDALALVTKWGQLMQQLPNGTMLAVPLSETQLQPFLNEKLSLAEICEPYLCVVSGSIDAIDTLQNQLTPQGLECNRLQTAHIFDSQMMNPILEEFTKAFTKVKLNPPQISFVSNVTGTWITEAEATNPSYWTKHLCQIVRCAKGLQQLLQKQGQIFLEVGSGQTWSTFTKWLLNEETEHVVLSSLPQSQDSQSDVTFLLTTLGKLWLFGVQIDWSGFYTHEQRHRLSLPTYPFERQRCWIEPKKQSNTLDKGVKTLIKTSLPANKSDKVELFYIPSWKRSPLSIRQPNEKSSFGCTLIFVHEGDLGLELVKRLELESQNAITVKVGAEFTQLSDRLYTLNPQKPDDYNTLIQKLLAQNQLPKTIIHLWNITQQNNKESELALFDQYQEQGFYSLLFLSETLAKQKVTENCQLIVISNNIQEVTGEEELSPTKATVVGLVKAIPQKYSNISCRSIDVEIHESGTKSKKQLIENLLLEITAQSAENVIAYRGNHRWVQTIEPIQLEKTTEKIPRLKNQGVYLITEGLEGIGFGIAEYLAQVVKAKLILMNCSPYNEENSVNCKTKQLERLGAEVLVVNVDVANQAQMREAITQSKKRFGQVNGVIHIADVLNNKVTQQQEQNILSPKVKATLVLNEIFNDEILDFFVLYSSPPSNIEQVDYLSTNAFFDAFSQYKNHQNGTFTVSINSDAEWNEGITSYPLDPVSEVAKPQPQEINHPLFDQYIEDANQEIYITKFSPGKHWLLNEHRINGKATLPGTAYLEIARAAFEKHANNGIIEIKEVCFIEPLMVEDNEEKEVRTILKKQKDRFEFLIVSQSSLEKEKYQKHCQGEIACVESEPLKKHDIKEIETECSEQQINITKLQDQAGFINLGSRWNNLKQIKLGNNQGLAILELPEEYANEINSYQLHPALLDTATGYFGVKDKSPHLPFSYKRLRIKKPLPTKIYSYVRATEKKQNQTETQKFNITILDEQGTELVEIEEYTQIRINEEIPAILESQNFFLTVSSPGILDTLTFQPAARQKPGFGEVEIEICTAGLNFREVLIALGMIPIPLDVTYKFGKEFAGRIVALGEGVEGFAVGQEVMGFGDSCFSPFVTTSAGLVVPKPDHISLEEAATIPAAFITAYYALINIGRLRRGERVLIHAAAGGVGLAAVQVAQWVGAEIFTTAGSPEKRAFLHSQGVENVMDSRSLSFADEVMQRTNDKGVDVVLNSLAGEFLTKSLSIMAPYGRFLELGKRDIFNNTKLDLRPFEKCLSFFALEVNNQLSDFVSTWHEVAQHIKDKNFYPLPLCAFTVTQLSQAFEYMARAKHIGKIVISLQDKANIKTQIVSKGKAGKIGRMNVGSSTPLHSTSSTTNSPSKNLSEQGLSSIKGIEAFSRILENNLPQVIVLAHNALLQVNQDNTFTSPSGLESSDSKNLSQPIKPRPKQSSTHVAPRNEIEQSITLIWQEILETEKVGIHDNFFEIGGNSLLMIQARSRLQELFNTDMSIADLFEYPTISALAEYLSQTQNEQPAFQEVHNRAKKQQEVMEAERKLLEQRRKARG